MTSTGTEHILAFYDALNARDYDRAAGYLTESASILDVATEDIYRGRAGFFELVRGWGTAFPDLRLDKVTAAGRGARTVVEYELSGTQTGPLVAPRGHIPPTGMKVHLNVCDVIESEGGAIAHIRRYFDSSTLLRQLGVISNSPLHAPDRRASLELYATEVLSDPNLNRAVVQRFIQDAVNRQDPSAAADTCWIGYQWHGGSLGETRGLAAYQQVLAALFRAFPDLQMEVLDCLAEGDRVMVRFAMSGTHKGEFQGVQPTARRVTSGGTSTYRLEKGRIVEEWWQGDILGLLQQLDAAPPSVPLSS